MGSDSPTTGGWPTAAAQVTPMASCSGRGEYLAKDAIKFSFNHFICKPEKGNGLHLLMFHDL